jgi:hypothetical protein
MRICSPHRPAAVQAEARLNGEHPRLDSRREIGKGYIMMTLLILD